MRGGSVGRILARSVSICAGTLERGRVLTDKVRDAEVSIKDPVLEDDLTIA